jgi:hypothetical protein
MVLDLIKGFSASIEMIKWFLSLLLLMWFITFIDFHMLNHPCIPGMNRLPYVVVLELWSKKMNSEATKLCTA